jgi:hypothetical protein
MVNSQWVIKMIEKSSSYLKGNLHRVFLAVICMLLLWLFPLRGFAGKSPEINVIYTADIRGTLFPCA